MHSLRLKLMILVFALVGIYAMILYVVEDRLVFQEFVALEKLEAQKDLKRCVNAIDQEIEHLDRFARDWAWWTATYNFASDHNKVFREENMVEESFMAGRVNLIWICDPTGKLVGGKGFDYHNETPLTIFEPDEINLAHPLMTFDAKKPLKERVVKGIIRTPIAPMLVVARPILRSDATGPPRGTIIFGRLLDKQMIKQLASQTEVDVKIWSLTDPEAPAECRRYAAGAKSGGTSVVTEADVLNVCWERL